MNERVPDDCYNPAFKFLLRNCGVKGQKSNDLMLVTRLIFGDLRCYFYNYSLEFFMIHI